MIELIVKSASAIKKRAGRRNDFAIRSIGEDKSRTTLEIEQQCITKPQAPIQDFADCPNVICGVFSEVMNKTLTRANRKKKSPAKSAKRSKKAVTKSDTTGKRFVVKKDGKYLIKKNGEIETREEREKRLAKRWALTLRVFRMAYDSYHN